MADSTENKEIIIVLSSGEEEEDEDEYVRRDVNPWNGEDTWLSEAVTPLLPFANCNICMF
jgi:hypothetical protein